MPKFQRRTNYRNWRIDQGFGQPFELNKESPQARGLVAWWPTLAEPGGGVLRDLIGTNHVPFGGANDPNWQTSAKRGQVLNFNDGNSEALTGPYSSAFPSYPFSISGWVLSDSVTVSQGIFVLHNSDYSQYVELNFMGSVGGDPFRLRVQGSGGSRTTVDSSTGYVANIWHHFAAVAPTQTGSKYVYLNGRGKNSHSVNSPFPTLDTIAVGSRQASVYLSGQVADVRIRNIAMSDSEVLNEVQNPWDLYKPVKRAPMWVIAAPPAGAIMNQLQGPNMGADLFNGTIL